MARARDQRARPAGTPSVARAVTQFALTGFAVLALALTGSLFIVRSLGTSEALRDARQFALISGQGIVEPALRDDLLRADGRAQARLDQIVQERVLGDRVIRVKIWNTKGRILYSDEARLIGATYPLDSSKLDVLRTGDVRAELSDLGGAENRYERGEGDLYEVYLPVRTPDGTPLLFETYQRSALLTSIERRIWLPFAALLLASLVFLWVVQVPLAWRLARSLQRSQRDREELLVRAVEASADERRRIAADLHDGVVQDLAGISYSLSALAESGAGIPPDVRSALEDSSAGTREAMRRLRSLLVDIHPPNLRASGLAVALRDLVSPLSSRGIEVTLEVVGEPELSDATELLFYRAAGEAIRNAERHAGASQLSVRVEHANGLAQLEVMDDGAGFRPERREESRAQGHVGLSLLEELVTRAGGTLTVRSAPGEGTAFRVEVPDP